MGDILDYWKARPCLKAQLVELAGKRQVWHARRVEESLIYRCCNVLLPSIQSLALKLLLFQPPPPDPTILWFCSLPPPPVLPPPWPRTVITFCSAVEFLSLHPLVLTFTSCFTLLWLLELRQLVSILFGSDPFLIFPIYTTPFLNEDDRK